jgi:hypothetical protein
VFVAAYDPNGVQRYSTYLGGSNTEQEPLITTTSSGYALVAGLTFSSDFPTRNALRAQYGNGRCGDTVCPDAFLAELTLDGSDLVYSTYLGGSAGARSVGLMPDGSEHAVIVLATSSPDFPVPLSASSCSPEQNVIVTFALDGRVVRSDTFMLGDASASVRDITRDSNGVLYIVGSVGSAGLPTVHPLQAHLNGYSDAFVAKDRSAGRAGARHLAIAVRWCLRKSGLPQALGAQRHAGGQRARAPFLDLGAGPDHGGLLRALQR